MAKPIRKEHARRGSKEEHLPLEPMNFRIIAGGIALIVVGYIALAADSVEGFLPLTVAPVLLVLGYCVVLPLGIIYRKGMFARKSAAAPAPEREA